MNSFEQIQELFIKQIKELFTGKFKYLSYLLTGVLVFSLSYLGYKYFILVPKNQKAYEEMSTAQRWFSIDSVQLALNGDISASGFLKIIKKYDGTDAANLAYFYAGNLFLKEKEYSQSIKYLEKFSAPNDFFKSRKQGLLGDAYSENGNVQEAVNNYYKAYLSAKKDEYWASENLYKGGAFALLNQEKALASKCFIALVREYPKSDKSTKATNYLSSLGVHNNKMGKF